MSQTLPQFVTRSLQPQSAGRILARDRGGQEAVGISDVVTSTQVLTFFH